MPRVLSSILLSLIASLAAAATPADPHALLQDALRQANARTPAALSKQLQAVTENPPQGDDASHELDGKKLSLSAALEAQVRKASPPGQEAWALVAVTSYTVSSQDLWVADFGSEEDCQNASQLFRHDATGLTWLLSTHGKFQGLRFISLGKPAHALIQADSFGCGSGGTRVYASLNAKGGLGPQTTLNWWQKSFFYWKDMDGDGSPELLFNSRSFLPRDILKKLKLERLLDGSPAMFHETQCFQWDGKKLAPHGSYFQWDAKD